MARLTTEEHEDILKRVSDGVNAGPEIMDLIARLREDFNESLSVDTEETVKAWEDKYNSAISERDKALGERDEARRAYRERFFSNAQDEASKIVDRQKEDSPRTLDYALGLIQEK